VQGAVSEVKGGGGRSKRGSSAVRGNKAHLEVAFSKESAGRQFVLEVELIALQKPAAVGPALAALLEIRKRRERLYRVLGENKVEERDLGSKSLRN
jgi:hypothetical protein